MNKVIYDIGANNGSNIPYYLIKGDLVVAIEANPILASSLTEKFKQQIEEGALVVINSVLTVDADSEGLAVEFYVHKTNNVLSQFPEPSAEEIMFFDKILVNSMSVQSVLEKYGSPHYIKIDVEHYDAMVLKKLYDQSVVAPYISAESHSANIFCLLVCMGYEAFKLVDGKSVSKVYSNRAISDGNRSVQYSFPAHSAGPFGNDVDGEWMSVENFSRLLAFEGTGWRDIHATTLDAANPAVRAPLIGYLLRALKHNFLLSLFRVTSKRKYEKLLKKASYL